MSGSSPHRIFSIPEVVEAILLKTDTRTLLTSAQRVCRHWQDLIGNNDNLQQALFLKPSGLRLGHVHDMVQSEELAAGIDPLVLWMDWIDLRSNERKYQGERARAMSRYVRTCDIFVFCHSCSLLNEDFRFKHWQNNGINGWLWKAQQRFFRKGRYRIPIWEDEEEMMEDRGEVEDKRREPEEVYILGPPRVVDPDDVEDSEDSDDSDSDFDDSDDT